MSLVDANSDLPLIIHVKCRTSPVRQQVKNFEYNCLHSSQLNPVDCRMLTFGLERHIFTQKLTKYLQIHN